MSTRKELINRYFVDLNVLTKIDKKLVQEIFVRKIKRKVEDSKKFKRFVSYSKNIRIIDKGHKFFNEYNNLKVGTLNWFETLSKSFRSYIGWYLQTKEMFERKGNLEVSEKVYLASEIKCKREVIAGFYDDYLDDDGEVKVEIIEDYYFNRKLEPTFYEKLFNLYRYILEDDKEEMLNDDLSIKAEYILEYCVFNEKIPSSVQEKIRVSVGRTKENFDLLAKANCEKFKYFVTLTFADIKEKDKHLKLNEKRFKDDEELKFIYIDDISSLESCNKAFNVSFRNLRRDLNKVGYEFYYLGCPEYHANGHVHYHFLFSDLPKDFLYKVPKWLDFDNVTKQYQNGYGLINWRYGKSDVQLIKDEYKVTSYIAKYIEKSLDEID